MSVKIESASLIDILPSSIKDDKKIVALCNALDAELQKLSAQTRLPLHLPRLEELPHEVLDQLAYQYNTIFYEPERMSLEKKRLLISNAILQWKKIGTRYALEKMLENFSQSAEILEWWQEGYKNPKPYHFKIKFKRLEDLAGDDGELLIRLINTVKNLRSWIEDFDFDLTREGIDEILHVAFAQILAGKNFYDLNSLLEEKQELEAVSASNIGGHIFYNVASTNTLARQNLFAAFHHFQSGHILYNTEIEVDEDLWYSLFLQFIKWKWQQWKPAKIIFDIDDEDDEDEEKEPEIFNQEFLRLWIDFHSSDHVRIFNIFYPRENLKGQDINAVNPNGIFIYKQKYLSNKIIRACYINKEVTKLYF